MTAAVPSRAHRTRSAVVVALLVLTAAVADLAPAHADPADLVPPAEITVCRIDDNRRVTSTETVPFSMYVKTVLPREFPTSWPYEVQKAGAVAIKSYAWYYTRHPWQPGTCDISDRTIHQYYNPQDTVNPPTATSNRAVDETWHVRLWDRDRNDPLFAQYCTCSSHPSGKSISQPQARDQANAGWTWNRIVAYAYREMDHEIADWRAGFSVAWPDQQPFAANDDAAFTPMAVIGGITPQDGRAVVDLTASCTIAGTEASHLLQTVAVSRAEDGRAVAPFDQGDRVKECAETEIQIRGTARVNGYLVASTAATVWKPWQSTAGREVTRFPDTDDAIAGAIEVSNAVFADAPASAAQQRQPSLLDLIGPASVAKRTAQHVVLARSDKFPDALSATGLAGPVAPILLTPGGPDTPMDGRVASEIERVLAPGGTVYVIGGPNALSSGMEGDLRARGFVPVRLAGDGRIATSVVVADEVLRTGGSASTTLLARAYPDTSAGWADAVTAGAYAAGARHPVLLTAPGAVDPRSEAWIEDRNKGVNEVVVLGGTRAVSASAEKVLDGVTVTRVSGATRAATAVAIAEQLWTREDAPPITRTLVIDAYRENGWAIALPVSVFAANVGAPQLIVTSMVPRHSTGAWYDRHADLGAIVVGGGGSVAARIDADLRG